MKNALLFRLGGLGDLLAALPAMRYLRFAFPSAKLALCSRKPYGTLLLEARVVDRVIPEESRELLPLFAGEPAAGGKIIMDALNKLSSRGAKRRADQTESPRLPRSLRSLAMTGDDNRSVCANEDFDLIIGWMQGERPGALEKTLAAAGLRARILFVRAPASSLEPLGRFFFDRTKEGLVADPKAPAFFDECARLPITQDMKTKGRALWAGLAPAGDYAVVHPGSGGAAKRWPLDRFMALVDRLSHAGIRGALVTGEAEEALESELARFPLPPPWLRLRSPDLSSLTGLLAESSLYVGNDSGMTHLAAACGAPTVALFREDLAPLWKPYGRAHLLKAQRLEDIPLDIVWATVSGLLGL